jgi:IS30 family transposase
MSQGKRVEVSAAQRTDIWQRWKVGQSLHEIGRAYGRTPSSIHLLLSHHGGIVPAARRRSPQALTLTEREDISRGIASGLSMREIATSLSRAASTVSREVARHGGRSMYRASEADSVDWSPEQVSWLKIQYPKDKNLRVSHETIYRSLFIQARGVLKKELIGHLRSKRRIRRSQHSSKSGHSKGQIVEAISIRERPAEIEDRAVPGHWEGDLISGTKNSHIVTLVERHSRFTTLIKVPSKETTVVVAALSRHIRKLPASLRTPIVDVGPGTRDGPT